MSFTWLNTLTPITLAAVIALTTTAARAEDNAVPRITLSENIDWSPMIPRLGNKGPAIATVFGKPGVIGTPFGGLVRVPAGGQSPFHKHTSEYWAIMVAGTGSARKSLGDEPEWIPTGSWWFQPGGAPHVNKCKGPEECVFFVYYKNGMDYLILDPASTQK
ncbi:hypothetical protein D9M69_04760 [compost metagenome]